jgi:hypothetical protein
MKMRGLKVGSGESCEWEWFLNVYFLFFLIWVLMVWRLDLSTGRVNDRPAGDLSRLPTAERPDLDPYFILKGRGTPKIFFSTTI